MHKSVIFSYNWKFHPQQNFLSNQKILKLEFKEQDTKKGSGNLKDGQ